MKSINLKFIAGIFFSVTFAGSLLLLAMAQSPPSSTVKETVLPPSDSLDKMPILELAKKLSEVQEKYGTIHYSTHLATFDSESAKRDGVSSDLITLAEESFEYQNELVRGLKTGKYNMVTGPGPDGATKRARMQTK